LKNSFFLVIFNFCFLEDKCVFNKKQKIAFLEHSGSLMSQLNTFENLKSSYKIGCSKSFFIFNLFNYVVWSFEKWFIEFKNNKSLYGWGF
jgi:hypothetical protein